jgi:hypothetical protein
LPAEFSPPAKESHPLPPAFSRSELAVVFWHLMEASFFLTSCG